LNYYAYQLTKSDVQTFNVTAKICVFENSKFVCNKDNGQQSPKDPSKDYNYEFAKIDLPEETDQFKIILEITTKPSVSTESLITFTNLVIGDPCHNTSACNSGTCISVTPFDGYRCECKNQYAGTNCQFPRDSCKSVHSEVRI